MVHNNHAHVFQFHFRIVTAFFPIQKSIIFFKDTLITLTVFWKAEENMEFLLCLSRYSMKRDDAAYVYDGDSLFSPAYTFETLRYEVQIDDGYSKCTDKDSAGILY